MTNKLEELIEQGEAPVWMTDASFKTLSNGYLLSNETPKGMYKRLSTTAADLLKKPELEPKFFELFWKNWLGPASPVCANFGASRGLPISCFSVYCDDSVNGIVDMISEVAVMSKHGGGVGIHYNDVRGRGAKIGIDNGVSDGVVPFIKIQDSTTIAISQGGTRKGATAAYLPVDHPDFDEFIKIRKPQGDANRQCLNIHHAVSISDSFMNKVIAGNKEAVERWVEIMKARFETGEPYIFFEDAVQRQNPETYKKLGLDVKGSNICCLSGDTLVLTKSGVSKIEDLVGKTVEIWDGKTWVVNDSFLQRGVDSLIEIELANGEKIRSNANHRWFAASSYRDIATNRFAETLTSQLKVGQWLESHDLVAPVFDEILFSMPNDWHRIKSITKFEGEHPVYCPVLPTTGKFALANGLMTGNTEIFLHTDSMHSFVCCLSSMNLARWDEWKNTDAVKLSIWFLDAVLEEFIQKAKHIPKMERAVRFAVKSRALGLGVMGWHTLLQESNLAMDSFEAYSLNAQIFRKLKNEAEKATRELAQEYGEPEWCKGFGRRNTHLIAVAPTSSNAIISGNISPSIEPWTANAFAKKTAKGIFLEKNKTLEKILESLGKNTSATWDSIVQNEGSIQHLDFLSGEQKEVFLTAREINQFVLIKQAEQRQRWIDQGQSLNLFFPANTDIVYFHKVHMEAWKTGVIKSLYYCRTGTVLKGDAGTREYKRESTDCKACEA